MGYERAARDAGVDLDVPLLRAGNFDPVAAVGDLVYVSGSIALAEGGGGITHVGRLGEGMDIETGQASARGAAAAILASVHQHLGTLDRVVRVNLKGCFLTGQAAAKQMVAQGRGGAIINMSSIQATITNANLLAYATCKGGVRQLTVAMALALAPKGIRVNAIGPGSIATDMVMQLISSAEVRRTVMSRTPMGRLGRPEEIAAVAAFLASDEASYLTGETVNADGGRLGLTSVVPVAD